MGSTIYKPALFSASKEIFIFFSIFFTCSINSLIPAKTIPPTPATTPAITKKENKENNAWPIVRSKTLPCSIFSQLFKIQVKQRDYSITDRRRFNPICPSFATPDATPNKKWATAKTVTHCLKWSGREDLNLRPPAPK